MNIDIRKMKQKRQDIISWYPAISIILLFGIASIFIPQWALGNKREDFFDFFFPVFSGGFIAFFLISFLLIKKRAEKSWGTLEVGIAFSLLFSLIFVVPQIFGHRQILFGLISVFYFFLPVFLAIIVYMASDRGRIIKEKALLEQQNLLNELAILKNQINPHFLFNTLNNIDSLIKFDQDKASSALIGLSDMMRYMLYDSDTAKVFLKQEIEHVKNYLKLQSIQHANADLVSYSLKGEVGIKRIAPMLFLPFIENAFKHCTNKETKHAIQISFEIEDGAIKFEAVNINDKTKKITKDRSGGAGLDIVKCRLQLLYPNCYSLTINDNNNLFAVQLIITYDNKDDNHR